MADKISDGHSEDEAPVGRRGFFGELARELIRPAMESWGALKGESDDDGASGPSSAEADYFGLLRPPGVQNEKVFLGRCDRSGECVVACPANAIRLFPDDGSRVARTPYIDPEDSPCVVCHDLACMSACPSGALQRREATVLDMGIAQVDQETCLRSSGDDCHLCIDSCPLHDMGQTVLDLTMDGRVSVRQESCVGCGCCQRVCPTSPRAIQVFPTVRIGVG